MYINRSATHIRYHRSYEVSLFHTNILQVLPATTGEASGVCASWAVGASWARETLATTHVCAWLYPLCVYVCVWESESSDLDMHKLKKQSIPYHISHELHIPRGGGAWSGAGDHQRRVQASMICFQGWISGSGPSISEVPLIHWDILFFFKNKNNLWHA